VFRCRLSFLLCVSVALLASSACTHGPGETQQEAGTSSKKDGVDRTKILQYSGVLRDRDGKRMTHVAGVLFGVYEQQEGGAPVWMEVQNVTPDPHGQFTALVGSAKSEGIPLNLFDGDKTLWLGMQVLLPGEVEQKRVRLLQGLNGLRTTKLVIPEDASGAPLTISAGNWPEKKSGDTQSTQRDQSQSPEMRPRVNRRLHGLTPPSP
jgi:hypothetical protein